MNANDIDGRAGEILGARVRQISDRIIENSLTASDLCESPIEQLMLARLLAMEAPYEQPNWMRVPAVFREITATRPVEQLLLQDTERLIVPQFAVSPYRLDFGLFMRAGQAIVRCAIECDGHDFHEKTKEQAARDKRRDRFLQAAGWAVFRYTGSEIWNGDEELLRDLAAFLDAAIERAWGLSAA